MDLHQGPDGIGGLRAAGQPLLGLLHIHLKLRGVLGGVVGAYLLDKAAIPGVAGIGHHNAVKGSFLGAHAAQSDLDGHKYYLQF